MLPRAPLYGRSPAAFGTGLVESLSSYVSRLCVARSVSVADVFDRLVRPLVPDGFLVPRSRLSLYLSHDSVDLDGLGPRTKHLVTAFEELTDQPDLSFHTFLPWRFLLSPRCSGVILRSGKRWCPRCFAHWRELRTELWEPLLWRVPSVRWCPCHQVLLAERCLVCGRTQRTVSQTVSIGYCERCGADLACAQWSGGEAACGVDPGVEPRWDWWTALAVHQMLAVQTEAAECAVPVGFAALVESARARCPRRSLDALAKHLGLTRSTLETARRNYPPLRLRTFLSVCMRLGANPVEVALAPYGAAPGCGWASAGLAARPWPRFNFNRRSSGCGRDDPQRWTTIAGALADLLRQRRVCSVTRFARNWEVAQATLRKRFPDLCRELSQRYEAQRAADRRRLREHRYQAVRDAVAHLVGGDQYPSRSRTFRSAGVYGLDEYDPALRDVWRAAVRANGLMPNS